MLKIGVIAVGSKGISLFKAETVDGVTTRHPGKGRVINFAEGQTDTDVPVIRPGKVSHAISIVDSFVGMLREFEADKIFIAISSSLQRFDGFMDLVDGLREGNEGYSWQAKIASLDKEREAGFLAYSVMDIASKAGIETKNFCLVDYGSTSVDTSITIVDNEGNPKTTMVGAMASVFNPGKSGTAVKGEKNRKTHKTLDNLNSMLDEVRRRTRRHFKNVSDDIDAFFAIGGLPKHIIWRTDGGQDLALLECPKEDMDQMLSGMIRMFESDTLGFEEIGELFNVDNPVDTAIALAFFTELKVLFPKARLFMSVANVRHGIFRSLCA